jgi:hypothetical protein
MQKTTELFALYLLITDPAIRNEKYYIALCGARVEKNCLHKQTGADGSYTRCYECRKIENARIVRARTKVVAREVELERNREC